MLTVVSTASTVAAIQHLRARDAPDLPHIYRTLKMVMPATIVGREHLLLLRRLARTVERDNIPGAIVECGVFRGASAAMMGAATTNRPLWLFDSFEGLPPGGEYDAPSAVATAAGTQVAHVGEVKSLLERVGVDARRVHLEPGWFKDTLSSAPRIDVALLHLDADWYESTQDALARFLPSLSRGGYLVVDDYQSAKFSGCGKAVREALGDRLTSLKLLRTGSGAWLRW